MFDPTFKLMVHITQSCVSPVCFFKWPAKADIADTELKFIISVFVAPTPVSGGRMYIIGEYNDIQQKFTSFSKKYFA